MSVKWDIHTDKQKIKYFQYRILESDFKSKTKKRLTKYQTFKRVLIGLVVHIFS